MLLFVTALYDSFTRLSYPRDVISLHKLESRNHMVESSVANPHTLAKEYRAFIAIDMVHELDLLRRFHRTDSHTHGIGVGTH